MSILSEYTSEEQMLLMEGPRLGAVVVAAASLGPKRETVSEGFAAARYVLDGSRGDYLDNGLVSSIQYEMEKRAHSDAKFADFVDLASAPGAKEAALERLHKLADLLNGKVDPKDAAGYRQWVIHAAVRASEAGKEGGGFLGRGAVQVNDAVREALSQVSAALGVV